MDNEMKLTSPNEIKIIPPPNFSEEELINTIEENLKRYKTKEVNESSEMYFPCIIRMNPSQEDIAKSIKKRYENAGWKLVTYHVFMRYTLDYEVIFRFYMKTDDTNTNCDWFKISSSIHQNTFNDKEIKVGMWEAMKKVFKNS